MTQPKKPPISLRLGEERLARIDAYAKKHALSRHLALLVLIDAGLRATVVKPQQGGLVPVTFNSPLKSAAKPVTSATKLNLQVGPAVRRPGDLVKKGSKK